MKLTFMESPFFLVNSLVKSTSLVSRANLAKMFFPHLIPCKTIDYCWITTSLSIRTFDKEWNAEKTLLLHCTSRLWKAHLMLYEVLIDWAHSCCAKAFTSKYLLINGDLNFRFMHNVKERSIFCKPFQPNRLEFNHDFDFAISKTRRGRLCSYEKRA